MLMQCKYRQEFSIKDHVLAQRIIFPLDYMKFCDSIHLCQPMSKLLWRMTCGQTEPMCGKGIPCPGLLGCKAGQPRSGDQMLVSSDRSDGLKRMANFVGNPRVNGPYSTLALASALVNEWFRIMNRVGTKQNNRPKPCYFGSSGRYRYASQKIQVLSRAGPRDHVSSIADYAHEERHESFCRKASVTHYYYPLSFPLLLSHMPYASIFPYPYHYSGAHQRKKTILFSIHSL